MQILETILGRYPSDHQTVISVERLLSTLSG